MTAPFLDIDAFAAEYQGTLSTGERTTATRLLQVISDAIRTLKPDVDTTAATMVVFEVVRDSMTYGHLGPLDQFENVTSRRKESGTLGDVRQLVDDYLTQRQCRLLGLPLTSIAAPRASFTKCDY